MNTLLGLIFIAAVLIGNPAVAFLIFLIQWGYNRLTRQPTWLERI